MYAVWSSQGFDNPEWAANPAEQQNTVWSVGIDAGGAFVTNDVRREFVVSRGSSPTWRITTGPAEVTR